MSSPPSGITFVAAFAGCLVVGGGLLAASLIIGKRGGPDTVPRYLRWLAAERPTPRDELVWFAGRQIRRMDDGGDAGSSVPVPQLFEVEVDEKKEESCLGDSGTSWRASKWTPVSARLLLHGSPPTFNQSSPPPFSSRFSPSWSAPRNADASPSPLLLVAFLIAPPRPTPPDPPTDNPEELVIDFDLGTEAVGLTGEIKQLLAKVQ